MMIFTATCFHFVIGIINFDLEIHFQFSFCLFDLTFILMLIWRRCQVLSLQVAPKYIFVVRVLFEILRLTPLPAGVATTSIFY